MRTLIVSEFVTLDGVMEAPGGEPTHPHGGWVLEYFGPEQGQFKLEETLAADTLLIGRVTYETAVRQGMRAYAGLKNYVVSTTLRAADYPEETVLREASAVDGVRGGPGKDIRLCGGGVLLASLIAAGLVDTLELGVSPRLLGKGTPMLALAPGLPTAVPLELTGHRALPSGLLILEYGVRRAR